MQRLSPKLLVTMKHLLVLLLAACDLNSSDVERRIGDGASCEKVTSELTFLCNYQGKAYTCQVAGSKVFCFEAVEASEIR